LPQFAAGAVLASESSTAAMQACNPGASANPGIRSCDPGSPPPLADLTTPLANSEATAHEPFEAFQTVLKTWFISFLPPSAKAAIEYFRM
jgi:hypothetical protein